MKNMSFPKEKVLEALRQNRTQHLGIVREAQQGFREKAIAVLEDKLVQLRAGKSVDLRIPLHLPENHVESFDLAIQMLEMCIEPYIELDERQFQCYIRNQWEWGRSFLLSNSSYSGIANTMVSAQADEEQ